MRLPLFVIARVVNRPWWSPRGWMLLTPEECRDLVALRKTLDEAFNDEPHRGPCRCTDCVITDDDPPNVRWDKAMRGLGLDPDA